MKYFILITLFILISCTAHTQVSMSFYEKVKQEPEIFKDYLKYEGLRDVLEVLNSELYNSKKIIQLSIYSDSRSAFFIYDCTNKLYFFVWKNFGEKSYSYEKLNQSTLSQMGEFNLFVLDFVLENKIEELKKISEEAYGSTNFPQYDFIRIIDIEANIYESHKIKTFDVYKGKPIMNEESIWNL